ncbi:MAG: hypothetical protein HQ582_00140 [Planctomycetes bacterium]|nr:hypothetical protein [Planctomycetota bacterium]
MTQERWTRVLAWTGVVLVLVTVAVAGRSGGERGALAAEQVFRSSGGAEEVAAKKRAFRGRLPVYYGRVVDEAQRQRIYAIQREFAPKIDALKAQLAALTEERNGRVEAVLSPQQLEAVGQFKAEAKAKRDKAKRSSE